MNADYRKGKQMYDKELQSFNLRSFVLIRVSSDKYYSVELCVTLWWNTLKTVLIRVLINHRLPHQKVRQAPLFYKFFHCFYWTVAIDGTEDV